MKIYSVFDNEFKKYGQVLQGFDTAPLLTAMKNIPMPETGTSYLPGIPELEACTIYEDLCSRGFGGMPIQLGMCWGYNTKLNALEYHRDSEINIGTTDFVLLLATRADLDDWKLDTGKVTAFLCPAGIAIEVYATSLHYAPCHTDEKEGFRVAVVLPRGTNTEAPSIPLLGEEDSLLFACNKWLIAHPESSEAEDGAFVGLTGKNLDITKD